MLPPLMPNANELVYSELPWLFDEESSADLALLQAVGVLGSMRESELALFFRGTLERDGHVTDHAADFAVRYPSSNGCGMVTCDSAVHATRRRLLALVKAKLLATAKVQRTTADNLAGWFYWLTRKGAKHLIDAGYRVRSRQTIHNMAHIGSVQDQHRLLEQQYLIARRLIASSLGVWGEYAIRSRLARDPVRAAPGTNLPTVKARLEEMSAQLFLTPEHLGDQRTPNTEENRRSFTKIG